MKLSLSLLKALKKGSDQKETEIAEEYCVLYLRNKIIYILLKMSF
jgi:hypothetical protein